jgi:hypothetical protein
VFSLSASGLRDIMAAASVARADGTEENLAGASVAGVIARGLHLCAVAQRGTAAALRLWPMHCATHGALQVPSRPVITPGRLYAMMSAEFQERRSRHCIGCMMPMLFHRPGAEGQANWQLETGGWRCRACEESVASIFAKYAAIYDVKDHTPAP